MMHQIAQIMWSIAQEKKTKPMQGIGFGQMESENRIREKSNRDRAIGNQNFRNQVEM